MRRYTIGAMVLIVGIALGGCAVKQRRYVPPPMVDVPEISIIVDKPFDEVWTDVVDYLSLSFAPIDLLDKDSGFARLRWSAGADRYVHCGTMEIGKVKKRHIPEVVGFAERHFSATANVFIKALGPRQTMVRAYVHYSLGSHTFTTDGTSVIEKRRKTGPSAGYETYDEICRPTYVAEGHLLGLSR